MQRFRPRRTGQTVVQNAFTCGNSGFTRKGEIAAVMFPVDPARGRGRGMTISAIDEAPSRAARREETARLLQEASTLTGAKRDQVIDQVIVLNIGVAHAIAHRYRNRSVPVE